MLVLGGKTKEFQAEIDLDRMRAFGLTLPQIISAISASNANVGGRTISIGEQSVNVRGIGVIGSLEDIGNIVLTQQGGVAGAAVRRRQGADRFTGRGSASPAATTSPTSSTASC